MRVPGHVAEGRGSPFPQGSFSGELTNVKQVWDEGQTNLDYLVTFTKNSPIDGPEVGGRGFTQRIDIINQNQSVVDIEDFQNAPFALVRSATLITQLASSLEFPMTIGADKSVDFDINGFLEGLSAGLYKGRNIGYEVKHRSWTTKKKGPDGKLLSADQQSSGTSADAVRFFSVQSNGTAYATTEVGTPVGTMEASSVSSIPEVSGTTVQTRK